MSLILNNVSLSVSQNNNANPPFLCTTTVGNLIVVGIATDETGGVVTGVTDDQLNAYTLNPTKSQDTVNNSGQCYWAYCFNATPGVTTIHVANTGGGGTFGSEVVIYDLSSVTGGLLDTIVAFNNQSGSNPAPFVTAATKGFVGVVLASENQPTAVAAPFTFGAFEASNLAKWAGSAYDVNGAGGLLTSTFTIGASGGWDALVLSLNDEVGGGRRAGGRGRELADKRTINGWGEIVNSGNYEKSC